VSGTGPAVLFELGTLGVELAHPGGRRLAAFRVDPEARRRLEELAPHARLGVIASDPELGRERVAKALARAGLESVLDADLLVAGAEAEDVFAETIERLGATAGEERILYTGPDASRRLRAAEAGLVPVPHPLLLRPVLARETLRHVRLGGTEAGWRSLLRGQRLVPLLRIRRPAPALYAIAGSSTLEMLVAGPTAAQPLAGDPGTQALFLLQVTPEEAEHSRRLRAFLEELRRAERILEETPDGYLLALSGDVSIDALHPPDSGHGHTRAGLPGIGLLQSPAPTGGLALRSLEDWERAELAGLDEGLLMEFWSPLVGQVSLSGPGDPLHLASRHVKHPHNETATAWLGARLQEICGTAWRVPFGLLEGATLSNLQADIPGTSDELVILAAHFDSTAANTPCYPGHEGTRPAPGGDDDASGVAGVLAAARILRKLADIAPPTRSFRFVLFNAEEQGLVGSGIYADQLKSTAGAQVAAAIQMDMIGWRSGASAPTVFEIHGTGIGDHAHLHAPAGQLAAIVKSAAAEVSPALYGQLHPLPGCDHDPASHRSDHESFLLQGWPACLVAEDLWAEVCASPAQTGNPDYHTEADVAVDAAYAADIARAVAAAAWILARPGGGAPPLPDPGGLEAPSVPPIASPPSPAGLARSRSEPSSGGAQPMPDPGPMPDVFLVEFLARWIRDESFRCQILHREIDGLTQFGLNAKQRAALLSLDREAILERLALELEHFYKVDLGRVRSEVGGPITEAPEAPIPIDAPLGGLGAPRTPGASPPSPSAAAPPLFPSDLELGRRLLGQRTATTGGGTTRTGFLLAEATVYEQGKVHVRGTDVSTATKDQDEIIVVLGQGFDASPEVRFEKGGQTLDAEVLGVHCGVDLYQRVRARATFGATGTWTVRARNAGDPEWSSEPVQIIVND